MNFFPNTPDTICGASETLPRSSSRRALTRAIAEFLSPSPPPPVAPSPALPSISVIIPSLNQARFLPRALLSVRNQRFPAEVLALDGGSSDGSAEILQAHAGELAFWRSGRDAGQGAALNEGAERARGEWLAWLNADDLLLPGALRAMAEAARRHPEAGVIYGDQAEVDERERVVKRVFAPPFDAGAFLFEPAICVRPQSALFRRDLFLSTGGLTSQYYSLDYEMMWRLHRAGAAFVRIPGFLSAFRLHPDSQTGRGLVRREGAAQREAIFRQATGRDRSLLDRTVLRYWHKCRRFASEPRAILGALEHRLLPPPRMD